MPNWDLASIRKPVVDKLYFDYHALLSIWAEVFGREFNRLTFYSDGSNPNIDICEDFFSYISESAKGFNLIPLRRNRGFSREVGQLLETLNRECGTDPSLRQIRLELMHVLEVEMTNSLGEGTSACLREDARRFMAQFEEGNESIRNEWFSSRASLFNINWNNYSDTLNEMDDRSKGIATTIKTLVHLEKVKLRKTASLG